MAGAVELPGSGNVDRKGNREYTRKFLVETDDPTMYPPALWSLVGISRYDSYPADIEAVAVTARAELHEGQIGFWDVTYTYSSADEDEGNSAQDQAANDQSVAPPDRPLVITYGEVKTERLLGPKDLDDNDVMNTAMQPFDPPPMVPCSNLLIHIEAYKELAGFDPVAKKKTYTNAINSSAFLLLVTPTATTTFDAKTVRCNLYDCTCQKENDEYWWKISIDLEVRDTPWNPYEILNAGTCYIPVADKPPQPILDHQGHPLTTAIPLGELTSGTVFPLNSGDTAIYLTFKAYNEADFSALLA